MKRENKNLAIWEWVQSYPLLSDLFFNSAPAADGATSIVPISSEKVLKWYIGGSSMREYTFGIVQYKLTDVDTPNATEGIQSMYDVERFMNWVTEQNKLRNFPQFMGCDVISVEVLNNMPQVTGRDSSMYKYMYQCRVTYKK